VMRPSLAISRIVSMVDSTAMRAICCHQIYQPIESNRPSSLRESCLLLSTAHTPARPPPYLPLAQDASTQMYMSYVAG
jgi:hypothetical protein